MLKPIPSVTFKGWLRPINYNTYYNHRILIIEMNFRIKNVNNGFSPLVFIVNETIKRFNQQFRRFESPVVVPNKLKQ